LCVAGLYPTSMQAAPEAYGFPQQFRNLTDLGLVIRGNSLDSAQRTDVLTSWLVRERAQPSPTTKGLGGGSIDSGYIQAQILMTLREAGDPLVLSEVAEDVKTDPGIRDGLRIALGLMGDHGQIPNLLSILQHNAIPGFRGLAATALGKLNATKAIPALRKSLSDPAHRPAGNCLQGSYIEYPVREGAEAALRILNGPKNSEGAKALAVKFAARLDAARKTRAKHEEVYAGIREAARAQNAR